MQATELPTPPPETNSLPASESTVFIPTDLHPAGIEHARKRFKKVLLSTEVESFEDALAESDGLVLRQSYKVTKQVLASAPKLRGIARNGVGYDSIDTARAKELGIAVFNIPGMNAETVAEMTFTLALSLLRRVNLVDRALRSGEDLSKVGIMGNTLRGKVVGIVGMGAIAHRTAELFRDTFQCELHVYSPTSSTDKWTENDPSSLRALSHTRHASLDTLLPIVDILTLHCPLTPSTHLLIGEKELATMKTSGLLINTARGGVVDEVALEVALREKVIAGAAVDVWEVEPPPPAKYGGLISQPTCISLPHMGALTHENQTQCCILAVDQLADHLDGKVVGNRVV